LNLKLFKFIKKNKTIVVIVIVSFFIRLLYGLSINFAEVNTKYLQDYTQIYLLGLKLYTTGYWPYFGPDITYTFSQIPGGLQSILVGLPFYFIEQPEAPFYFLNIISFSALLFMSWYVSKRIQQVPKWFIYAWLFLSPWTMNFSTTIINPSYLLAPSILFFIAIIEILPIYKHKLIKSHSAFFMTGLSLAWISQLHMSWVLLPFFIIYSFYFELIGNDKKQILKSVLFFILGFLIIYFTVIPTYIKYGISAGNAGSSVSFNLSNFKNIDILTRFFAFSTFDVKQFINGNWHEELLFLKRNIVAAPIIILGYITGVIHILWSIFHLFKASQDEAFKKLRTLVVMAILLTYISYLFAIRNVATYTFYLLTPLSFMYSFYVLQSLFKFLFWRRFAVLFILSSVLFHCCLASTYFNDQSLFSKRKLIKKALLKNDSRLFAYRRIPTWERLERENLWQCNETKLLKNKRLTCFLDFDHFPHEIQPEALNIFSFKSAPYSYQLDSIFEQSIVLSKNHNDLNGYHLAKVTLDLKYSEVNDVVLVINEQVKDSLVFWKQIKLGNDKQKEKLWHQVIIDTEFPPLLSTETKLDITIWLPKSRKDNKVLIDNFKVDFY
jgi:hypothetical protein